MISGLRPLIQEAIAHWQMPALSVAVAISSDVFWSEGFGLADVENQVAATADTVYRMASITKPITAVAVMQLAEQGKLDLDAPIQEYVPEFPEKSKPITARLLLSHLSGIRDFADHELPNRIHYPYTTTPLTTFLDRFKDDPLLHEPGIRFRYSTPGYNLLGCAIEGASGTSYREYVRTHIFQPAGMERTYVDDVRALIPHRARGYVREEDGNLQHADFADSSDHLPGGGFCSTVGDAVRFGVAVQTGKLLRPATLTQMFTRQYTTEGRDTRFGLGWFVFSRNGEIEAAHGGKHFGTSTMLTVRMQSGIIVGLMTNLQGVSSPYMHDLSSRLYGKVCEL